MQDEIELLELNSPSSTSQNSFPKKDSKVSSTPYPSKVTAKGDGNHEISNLFLAKPHSSKSNKTFSISSKQKYAKSDTISEISDDVFILTDRKNSIESLSKTESKSYKDRIKDRFQTIRENAGKSAQRVSFKNASRKLIINKIRQENNEIDEEIKQKMNQYKKDRMIDAKKMYDFFVSENNPHVSSVNEINSSTEPLIIPEDENDLVEFKYPKLLRFQQKEAENQHIFKPSGKPVEISRKIDESPRYLEDEGFFVPPAPKIPRNHLNLIEERLLSHDDRKWFDCDGELKILENPLTHSSIRPFGSDEIPKENLTIFSKPLQDSSECEEVLVIRENVLHLNLKNIQFQHHHLFSLEHVLERNLKKCCEKYEKHLSNNTLKKLRNQLEASRHILMSSSVKSSKYRKEVKELRDSLFVQGKQERELLKSTLNLWKNIKKLRTKNGYSNTPVKLMITKEVVDLEKDTRKYEENLQKAYKEILNEYRENFKVKMRAYKETLQEIRKDEIEISCSENDSPKKPDYNIDEENVLEKLRIKFSESFRAPGEPIVRFKLVNENEITKTVENSGEIARRAAVEATKIQLRIICNKLTVCKTKPVQLSNHFTCNFNENISILLTNIPKFITLIIIEQCGSLQKRILSEINLDVPAQNKTKTNTKFETFSKKGIIKYKHEAVGCGNDLRKEFEKRELSNVGNFEVDATVGTISYSSFWETKNENSCKNQIEHSENISEVIDKNGCIKLEKLTEWVNENKPDPMNPKNSVLYEYIQNFDEDLSVLNKRKHFRLNPHQKSLKFCENSELDANIRMKILQLRNRNEPEFDGMLVPNRIKEIPLDVLKDYKKRILEEQNEISHKNSDISDDYDARRKHGSRILRQIYTKIYQKCKSSANNLEYEDVVDEKYILHFERFIRTLISNFFNWFSWNRRLRNPLPTLKKTSNVEKKEVNHHEISSATQVRIKIKVLSGINIPVRTNQTEDLLKPFVEVRYEDILDRTSKSDGNQPVWNEELSLLLNYSHFDYLNPNSLNGNIVVSIFDEIGETANWLGSFEVPISAICSNNEQMEGNFKVNLPNLMFGYTKGEYTLNQNFKITDTYINLKFSIHPNVTRLVPSIDELSSSELPFIRDYILRWNESYNSSFPSRKFSALAINSQGKTACLTRYIKPLEPPQLNNEGFDIEPDQCAKYISLIPFTNCNYFYQNVWISTDQLLSLLTGSVVDHAVALTCFFLALKLDVWLLLGFGIPNGSTAYVFLRERSKESEIPSHFIYDVVTGEKFSVLDPFCPLQKIYCLIRENNIWANVQRNDNVALTRFDLTRKSDWMPLFSNDFPAPTNSIQNRLSYEIKIDPSLLEENLERKIKRFVSKSRQLSRTVWNKRISSIIKNNIHLIDYVHMHGRSNLEISNELARQVAEYNVRGIVLGLPYTNIQSIVKKLRSVGVYFQFDENVEFSLAVKIQAQPNCVALVWIFIATLKENV